MENALKTKKNNYDSFKQHLDKQRNNIEQLRLSYSALSKKPQQATNQMMAKRRMGH